MHTDEDVYKSRILIVDDQEPNVLLLERLLAGCGFTDVTSTTRSAEVVDLRRSLDADILLLDLQMPAPDGFEVMRLLEDQIKGAERLPVLVLTADASSETKQRALSMGASDFVNKPFDVTEVFLRIRNLLMTRSLQQQLRRHNVSLEERVRERTHELEAARIEIVERLARAAEYRDDDTGEHTRRVGQTSALMAEQLGLARDFVERIRLAAPLHDVGKLGISDVILLKPGKLTPEEFELMKRHTRIGAEILGEGGSRLLELSQEIALTHHEWWDGSGYPAGLRGDSIPLAGRIVALADVFDALTHARPYKPAWPIDEGVTEIDRLAGRQFDPAVVDAFGKLDPHELIRAPELLSRLDQVA
jgi:response regulator RpfG family c-di-GMP phosphodiesterase